MDACRVILDNKEFLRASGLLAILLLEFWMGKTDKIQASSILEALLNLFKKRSTEDQK